MTMTMQDNATRLADLPSVPSVALGGGPDWLQPARRDALARFAEMGIPGRRDEEWRYMNLKPLAEMPFRFGGEGAAISPGDIEPFLFAGLTGPRLVFVDGRYRSELSEIGDLPAGVTVEPLAQALGRRRELLEPHLCRAADERSDAFLELNTAMFGDGVLVHVPRGVIVGEPIYVLSLTTASSQATVTSPRNLVIAEPESSVCLIEDYAALTDGSYLTNAFTEVVVGANAEVAHYLIERESSAAFNISTLRARQERDSRFASHSVLLGGGVVRNNVNPILGGEGCDSLLNGLFVGEGEQHLDNHMRVEHAMPHCESRQFYRGILADRAHGVFSGRIIVAVDAQKTDAVQSNDNLLLSDSARVNTKPQLEIYADDVKCTHGATIGQLNEEGIFYLRSRGLPAAAARAALVYAFARESLDRMKVEPVRQWLARTLLDRLPESDALHRVFD